MEDSRMLAAGWSNIGPRRVDQENGCQQFRPAGQF
jgi:hypothetical protein